MPVTQASCCKSLLGFAEWKWRLHTKGRQMLQCREHWWELPRRGKWVPWATTRTTHALCKLSFKLLVQLIPSHFTLLATQFCYSNSNTVFDIKRRLLVSWIRILQQYHLRSGKSPRLALQSTDWFTAQISCLSSITALKKVFIGFPGDLPSKHWWVLSLPSFSKVAASCVFQLYHTLGSFLNYEMVPRFWSYLRSKRLSFEKERVFFITSDIPL